MIIGRAEEIRQLQRAYVSEYSEFVAVYGRRRIGKTFLIRESFKDSFTFQYTGVWGISNKEQLGEFYQCLIRQGLSTGAKLPKSWFEAFHLLEDLIISSRQERKIIFLDELPWMDAPNSKFIPAFEHFWNGWASARKDILLIICGSATSWIINKIFRNKGGLYNRVTYRIRLNQFSLAECEEFVKFYRMPFNRNMILEGYMVMGGIPYYWSKLDASKSMGYNINNLFLKENGMLRDEFSFIYASIFNRPEKYLKVVEALAGKKSGLTRDEIIMKSKLESNGQLSGILEDLIECGFVRKYCHTDKRLRDAIYQLVDCYTLFYYQFVKVSQGVDEEYWVRLMRTPTYNTWCGLSFERVCLLHTRQIKIALGISGIMANIFSWHIKGNDYNPGVQIDLLIDRADNVVNVCEMKYAPEGYVMTAGDLKKLKIKLSVLRQHIPARKYIGAVMVTSNGVIRNQHSSEVMEFVSADQLFAP
jgi:ATPase